MSRMRVCAALLVLSAACARTESTSDATSTAAAPTSDRATAAARVSNAIEANPAAADSILKANGYTAETFQRAMYEIAQDSAQSAVYAAARSQ